MGLLFLALWIILNGRVSWEIVLIGLVIMVPVYWFACRFFEWSIQKEIKYFKVFIWSIRYVFVLLVEIIKANLQVMKLILSNRVEVEPKVTEFNVKLKENSSRVLLANSITLTPGTITVKMDDEHYLVHGLDCELLEGIESSVFVELLEKREIADEKFISKNTKAENAKRNRTKSKNTKEKKEKK